MDVRRSEPRDRLRRVLRVAYDPPPAVPGARGAGGAAPEEERPIGPRADTGPSTVPAEQVARPHALTPTAGGAPRRARRGPAGRWSTAPRVALRTGVVVLVLAVLATVAVLVARPGAPQQVPELPEPRAPSVAASPDAAVPPDGRAVPTDGESGAGATDGAAVVVHVAGAVVAPGVYRLVEGARVHDAVLAAGGARPDADLDSVNLAGVVLDGQQVYLPVVGEDPVTRTPAPGPQAGSGPQPVDLNAAGAADLESLPGIGPALAQRILAWREENGGFDTVDELTDVPGIGPTTMARLRDLVTV